MAVNRRTFLKRILSYGMLGTALVTVGSFASIIFRFLFPMEKGKKAWLYVAQVGRVKPGDSLSYQTPKGAKIEIARLGNKGDVSDFVALSNVCPHLGCRVHWQEQNNRFFCPCHNGVFNPDGKAIAGPPAQAGQSLKRYSLKIEKELLYVRVDVAKGDKA